LVKKGKDIKLIEVKSKSFDPNDEFTFVGKRGAIVSGWKPYLFDIAFQKYVMQLCHPEWNIRTYLMMADKTKEATIDGLNQLFRITKTAGNRTGIVKLEKDISKLGQSILGTTEISTLVNEIIDGSHRHSDALNFKEAVDLFKDSYINDKYPNWPLSYRACKACEFKTTTEDEEQGLLSGFRACFSKQLDWSSKEFQKPNTLNIWDFRCGGKLMEEGKIFKDDVVLEDIGYKEEAGHLSRTERQWLQIEKERDGDMSSYIDRDGLKDELAKWVFPLHFIDFETCTAALPFNMGRRPYEQIAFQFSHHILHQDGRVEHQSEYIDTVAGKFPNFDFVRALMKALSYDNGSVFKYSNHENTILNVIYRQLDESNEADKQELMAFIQTITKSTGNSADSWVGERNMIDLLDVVKRYYYNPYTYGSNSLKAVLPAILKTSEILREKYSQPIGGIQVSSKNFPPEHVWLQIDGDEVQSPYEMLPPIFDDWTEEDIEKTLSEIENLADGGAAMTAYGKLQYTDMTEEERESINQALLKYCELDTLAMVMLVEYFLNDISHYC
jgi:hypothetical protein